MRGYALRSAPSPNMISSCPPPPRDLATSVRVRALTSKDVDTEGSAGLQRISFMASRYRSVARNVMVSPSISTLTAVRIGRVSSLEAATVTWATAWANSAPSTVPAAVGSSGRAG